MLPEPGGGSRLCPLHFSFLGALTDWRLTLLALPECRITGPPPHPTSAVLGTGSASAGKHSSQLGCVLSEVPVPTWGGWGPRPLTLYQALALPQSPGFKTYGLSPQAPTFNEKQPPA